MMNFRARVLPVVLGVALGATLVSAGAAHAAPGKKIPEGPGAAAPDAPRSAEAILADVVTAMGGEAAWKSHSTMVEKIELSIAGLGMNGTGERTSTRDDKSLLTTQLPGIGTSRQGSNGKVLWSEDPINGLRLLTGAEAESARVESAWAPELHFTTMFKKIDVTSETSPAGAPLECLVLTPHAGAPITNCYDAKTHLQVLQKGTHPTPQGDTPFTSLVKDWHEVGGLKMPFAVETTTGPITFSLHITDCKLDVPVDDKLFEPPAGASTKSKGKKAPKMKAPAKTKAKAKP
jgi:hypothetical protein